MAFDFEAIIGHLYVVSGRSINASPPGLLVEAAPRKAARGRETDTFFGLVLPSGHHMAPANFYERMVQMAAERYFQSSGSVTAGVRALCDVLNENLYEHNEAGRRAYEANLICAILHGTDVFLARVGGGVALLQSDDETQLFPASFDQDEALYGAPLGVQPVPDIKMAHYRLVRGARLIMADNNLADFEFGQTQAAAGMSNLGEVILVFKTLAKSNLTLLAAEFVPPETSVSVVTREGHSSRPDVVTEDQPPASVAEKTTGSGPPRLVGEAGYQVMRGASTAALRLADSMDAVSAVVDKVDKKTAEKPGRLSGLFNNGSAVLIPVALVVLVLIMWVVGTGASEFEICLNEATDAANLARGIASNDVTGTLAAWNAVLLTVERCNEVRPGEVEDVQLAALTREGQSVIDRLNEIERRDVIPIEAFPNATLKSAVLRGEDLYVLDEGNDQVYRVTLADDGLGMVANTRQPIASMRRGAGVSSFTINNLIDITWSEDGSGLSQGNVLLALDENGVLVEYSPTFLARGVQKLIGSENWDTPTRIAAWRGRLYILDPGAEQIWRYDPSGGTFPGAPLEYFTGANRPDLENAIDFGIDDSGRVYVLFEDGVIAMFRGGEELRFGFAGFPPNQDIKNANAMFLNIDPVSPGIYVVDRLDRTVYETSMAGTFINSYRTFDETLFAGLSDVVVDENRKVVYVLSGNSVLAFPK